MDYYDLYGITPEEEAEMDARDREDETDRWLERWSDDFWSDEWMAALPSNYLTTAYRTRHHRSVFA